MQSNLDNSRHIPERTCVGCFIKKPQADFISVTRLKRGEVVVSGINLPGRAVGRSAYLCTDIICFKKAKNRKGKNGFEYALKIKIQPEIWLNIEKNIPLI